MNCYLIEQCEERYQFSKERTLLTKHQSAKQNESQYQEYHKSHADTRRNAKHSQISVEDTVLVKQDRTNKFYFRFSKIPYTVVERKGTMITVKNADNHRITRNISH